MHPQLKDIQTYTPDFSVVTEFENRIAEFFGAPFAVAVDSCTHGLELCLRMNKDRVLISPTRTYLSVPMLADKLGLNLMWNNTDWQYLYYVGEGIIDAATLWAKNSYIPKKFMCLSFQHQKHLSLGRGGMILCPDKKSASQLRKMAYDGRERGIPWREQDIDTMGYHYYMTPETAALGLHKLQVAIDTPAKVWDSSMYPDLTQMKIFNK